MKHSLVIFAIVLFTALSGLHLYNIVKADFELYKLESACVADLIAVGTPRRAIITKDGTCSVNINKL